LAVTVATTNTEHGVAERVTKINGTAISPLTNNFVCSKVRNLADHLYCDERVLTPLLRTGPKGSGGFRPATWDEALDVVASRLRDVVARHGAEAVLPYHYGGSNGWLTEGALATRFFRRLGASRLERTLCAAATTPATHGLYGVMPGVAIEDYVDAKLIVIWGANPSATSIHMVPIIERAMAAGAKLIVVDPRRTPLAKRADLHVALQPGTDLPVALALLRGLFRNGADRSFLHDHCTGADELEQRCERWTFAEAARVANVDVDTLQTFYQMYCDASPAVIRVGWGPERNRNGGSAIASILALPAVAGKFGVRAGGFTMSNGDARWGVKAETAIAEPVPTTRSINMSEIARVLRDGPRTGNAPIEALFVYNCNPVATAQNQQALIEQLSREDLFVVVHEQVMTDTALLADVVLPATAFVEHRELRRGYGTMRMYDSPAVVAAPGQARSNNQLFGELLQRFELTRAGDPMTDDELVAATFAASPDGAQLQAQLKQDGAAVPLSGARPITFVDVFPSTPDQRVHLVPAALDQTATHGLYTYQPDPSTDEFPLALISPALATQISSTFGQLRQKAAQVELSLADAQQRGVADGDLCRVWNNYGEVVCAAVVNRDLKPGVALIAKGYWRKHTRNGLTANALIPETFADLGGQAAFNDARVQVAKR
jgi:anaerobic selenocysteine-containing dehydrogenase